MFSFKNGTLKQCVYSNRKIHGLFPLASNRQMRQDTNQINTLCETIEKCLILPNVKKGDPPPIFCGLTAGPPKYGGESRIIRLRRVKI